VRPFGKRDGGGRRNSARLAAPLPALLSSTLSSRTAILEDVSCTGARLQATDPPSLGEEILIKVERLTLFGKVVWSKGGECGVRFDQPLTRGEVLLLSKNADAACFRGLSPDDLIALRDWTGGLAR